ncbi:hypothetical protein PV11_08000 [Exophiala sideris]|uniref:Uncharacterized protein n=1 Tax=Exophiala sideris TaxID=1016849 RepID=A0A0D1YHR7_9EURO|nr:hypothetical protein PV11_08000 [Exophiala sideris]
MDVLRRTASNDPAGGPGSPSTQRSPNPQSDSSRPSLPATTDPPSPSNPPKQKVWLIFGATGHMGRSVTKTALSHGDIIAAVGQSFQDDLSSMQTWHDDPDRYLALLCDVRIRPSVSSTLEKTIKQFGRIDIIANCSGYGVIGACEDQDEHEIRNQFEVNFMGTLNIIQLSLPYFRKRQEGRYLIFSSTSGALGVPGLGPYCATKYAVEGLIESMLYEVDPFNIKATLVEPGHVRRDDEHVQNTDGSKLPLFGHFKVAKASEPYMGKDAPAAHAQRTLHWMGKNQPTSVVKSAELVWQLGHCRYPPLRLLLGSFAVESIRDRLKSIIEEIEDWKHLHFPPLEGMEEKADDGEGDGEGADGEDGEDDQEQDQAEDEEVEGEERDEQGKSAGHGEGKESQDIKDETQMDVDG